jgi:uncharacterized membrane protein YphA (DoxX/SURF4 family)
LVYISGLGLLGAAISMIIGKWDKLASVLLAVMLLLFVFLVHLQPALEGDMGQLLKDTALAGGALNYAKYMAKDNAVIG